MELNYVVATNMLSKKLSCQEQISLLQMICILEFPCTILIYDSCISLQCVNL